MRVCVRAERFVKEKHKGVLRQYAFLFVVWLKRELVKFSPSRVEFETDKELVRDRSK